MGAVFEAEHAVTARRVAIKVLERRSDLTDEMRERFELEARASTDIAHPNVVEVFDAGSEADGSLFIAMELLEGETLDAVLKRDGIVERQRLGRIMSELLDGLAAMHTRGYIHRDLKPANIFLHMVDGVEHVKLLDFGIAKVLGEDGRTRTGMVMGTPAFMAPEQMRNAKAATPQSDLWSVGVILYECLVGHRPFRGETFGLLAKITGPDSHVPLADVNSRLPSALCDLVDELLSKNPAYRPGSASELRARLVPLIAKCPPLERFAAPDDARAAGATSVERPGIQGRAPRTSQRRAPGAQGWRRFAAVGLGVACGLVAVAGYARMRLRARPLTVRATVETETIDHALHDDPVIERFVRRWADAASMAAPLATWNELYATEVSFRASGVLQNAAQIRRYWVDTVTAGGRFQPMLDRAEWIEENADLNHGVSAACINLFGASGRVITVVTRAHESAGLRADAGACPEADGLYRLRMRRASGVLRICQEGWVVDEEYCRGCPRAEGCAQVRSE